MDHQIDEDDYFGDDFEQLPANTLRRLESDAITLSQQASDRSRPAAGKHGDVSAGTRTSAPLAYLRQQESNGLPNESLPQPPSSDYGLDDEDVIDLDDSLTYIAEPQKPQRDQAPAPYSYVEDGAQDTRAHQERYPSQRQRALHSDVVDLQARIAELEHERGSLQRSVEDAKTDAQSKAGAISILRANNEKTAKEYERKLSVMQKLHAEEVSKQRHQLEEARKERETVKTNNRFLEHDLAQEVERAKRIKSTTSHAVNGNVGRSTQRKSDEALTPRKNRHLADGFDDHEMMAVSPSKSKEWDKDRTPKAGGKRKRAVEASPIPLAIRQPTVSPPALDPQPSLPTSEDDDLSRRLAESHLTIQTIQRVLNHTPILSHQRTVEALVKFAFPKEPSVSLSSLLLLDLAMMTARDDASASVQVCQICMRLWQKCLLHEYLEPLGLLLDLFEFVLLLMPSDLQAQLIQQIVPLTVRSIDLVALPLVKAVSNAGHTASGKAVLRADPKQDMERRQFVDVDLLLSILHRIAMSASQRPESTRAFWERMEVDFVLVMLQKQQPLPQIRLMVQMIASSAMVECLGTIQADPARQVQMEAGTLDRLTSLLFETPNHPPDEDPYSDNEIASLQIEIIQALRSICLTDHGSMTIAQHRVIIGRLIRFLHGQVTSLYSTSPVSAVLANKTAESSPMGHDLIIATVNLTVRLLYHLLHSHTDIIDLHEKLAIIPGGHQKFLVCFTRLAFSEQLVFDSGLEEEVVDAAHEILDGVLGPEEGEAVLQAVETPRGATASRMSIPAASAPG